MKQKWMLLLLVAALAAGIWFCRGQREVEDGLPPMVMVDGVLYQLYDVQKEPPNGEPDGEIREIVGNQLPAESGQANFGEAGWPYWKTGVGICVYGNENYLLFKVQE